MVSDFFEKRSEMSGSLAEASLLMREIAGNGMPGESVKSVLRRLGSRLKDWTPSRIKDVWYADSRVSVRSVEIEQLRALAKRRGQDKADRDELDELRQRISRLEALLESTDEAFHSSQLDALRSTRS